MRYIYLDDLGDLCVLDRRCSTILYADDFLVIAPTVTKLESLLHACEHELQWLDMTINFKKSCCLRIGPRCNARCTRITSSAGYDIAWVQEIKYYQIPCI